MLKTAQNKKTAIFSDIRRYVQTDNIFLFLPNIIDYIRLVLLALFVYYAAVENYVAAGVGYTLSVALDEVDGNLARYLGQTTLTGMVLDILIDEASVICICLHLGTIYPSYIIVFQLYIILDISAQWTNYQHAAMFRNNDYTRKDDPLLNVYFNKKVFTNLWVYGNHVFLLMLYLCHFTHGPWVPLIVADIGLWKLLAYLSAPWSVSRLVIMLYLLLISLTDIARQEGEDRQHRNQLNTEHLLVLANQQKSQNGRVPVALKRSLDH